MRRKARIATGDPAEYRFCEDGSASFVHAYWELSALARLKYTTILDIQELADDQTSVASNNERLARNGHGDFTEIQWRVSDADDDYGTDSEISGGGTIFAKNREGRLGALVCISRCPAEMRDRSVEVQYAAHHVPVLCHELGHVDDFEGRVNLVPTKRLDITAAEVYAHRYACKMMTRHNLSISLHYYLDAIIPSLLKCEMRAHEQAANLFLASGECKRYKALAR